MEEKPEGKGDRREIPRLMFCARSSTGRADLTQSILYLSIGWEDRPCGWSEERSTPRASRDSTIPYGWQGRPDANLSHLTHLRTRRSPLARGRYRGGFADIAFRNGVNYHVDQYKRCKTHFGCYIQITLARQKKPEFSHQFLSVLGLRGYLRNRQQMPFLHRHKLRFVDQTVLCQVD